MNVMEMNNVKKDTVPLAVHPIPNAHADKYVMMGSAKHNAVSQLSVHKVSYVYQKYAQLDVDQATIVLLNMRVLIQNAKIRVNWKHAEETQYVVCLVASLYVCAHLTSEVFQR